MPLKIIIGGSICPSPVAARTTVSRHLSALVDLTDSSCTFDYLVGNHVKVHGVSFKLTFMLSGYCDCFLTCLWACTEMLACLINAMLFSILHHLLLFCSFVCCSDYLARLGILATTFITFTWWNSSLHEVTFVVFLHLSPRL